MARPGQKSSLEDVLDEFLMELDLSRATLERYLTAYPEYTGELVDMSRELGRPVAAFEGPLTAEELELVETGWRRHEATILHQVIDPFASLTIPELRQAAVTLGVPRQILTSFRERRVLPTSVPDRFLKRLAGAMATSAEALRDWVGSVPPVDLARSYKSESKPEPKAQVTFERILMDAQVAPERQVDLLSETD